MSYQNGGGELEVAIFERVILPIYGSSWSIYWFSWRVKEIFPYLACIFDQISYSSIYQLLSSCNYAIISPCYSSRSSKNRYASCQGTELFLSDHPLYPKISLVYSQDSLVLDRANIPRCFDTLIDDRTCLVALTKSFIIAWLGRIRCDTPRYHMVRESRDNIQCSWSPLDFW